MKKDITYLSPSETTRKLPVSSQLPKVKRMLKLPWPLLKVNLRILGLIGRGTKYFAQLTQLLS